MCVRWKGHQSSATVEVPVNRVESQYGRAVYVEINTCLYLKLSILVTDLYNWVLSQHDTELFWIWWGEIVAVTWLMWKKT